MPKDISTPPSPPKSSRPSPYSEPQESTPAVQPTNTSDNSRPADEVGDQTKKRRPNNKNGNRSKNKCRNKGKAKQQECHRRRKESDTVAKPTVTYKHHQYPDDVQKRVDCCSRIDAINIVNGDPMPTASSSTPTTPTDSSSTAPPPSTGPVFPEHWLLNARFMEYVQAFFAWNCLCCGQGVPLQASNYGYATCEGCIGNPDLSNPHGAIGKGGVKGLTSDVMNGLPWDAPLSHFTEPGSFPEVLYCPTRVYCEVLKKVKAKGAKGEAELLEELQRDDEARKEVGELLRQYAKEVWDIRMEWICQRIREEFPALAEIKFPVDSKAWRELIELPVTYVSERQYQRVKADLLAAIPGYSASPEEAEAAADPLPAVSA